MHAGLLPSDPKRPATHHSQPLSKLPILHQQHHEHKDSAALRAAQEAAILTHIKPNTDAWVNMNMRGVTKEGKITRTKAGTFWTAFWNRDMKDCHGFHRTRGEPRSMKHKLYCMPATVVYGHTAARGLDRKRWSVGLDSGCVSTTFTFFFGSYSSLVSSGSWKEIDCPRSWRRPEPP